MAAQLNDALSPSANSPSTNGALDGGSSATAELRSRIAELEGQLRVVTLQLDCARQQLDQVFDEHLGPVDLLENWLAEPVGESIVGVVDEFEARIRG